MATIKKIFEWMFYLIENTITSDPSDKIAKVKSRKTKTIDDIAARIVSERTEFRRETIVNIIKLANTAKLEFLSQGEMVNDGVIIYEPAIKGTFNEDTVYNESQHRCMINTRVTNDVLVMLKQVKGVYSGLSLDNGGAVITGVTDTVTGSTTGWVTPGKTITIVGRKIRVVPEEGETVESCITYTYLDTGQVITQKDVPVINDPAKIVLQLPMLDAGFYTLTLKTLFSSGNLLLKASRYITFKTKLEVK